MEAENAMGSPLIDLSFKISEHNNGERLNIGERDVDELK